MEFGPFMIWIILQAIILIYIIILVIMGKCFKTKEILSLVINNYDIILLIQKMFGEENKEMLGRPSEPIRLTQNKNTIISEKEENLIE